MPRPGRLSAGLFNEAEHILDRQRRRDGPARPVHLRTGGEPPFTRPRGFHARFAKPSGHRPRLAGNANRCIRDGTRGLWHRGWARGCVGMIFTVKGRFRPEVAIPARSQARQ